MVGSQYDSRALHNLVPMYSPASCTTFPICIPCKSHIKAYELIEKVLPLLQADVIPPSLKAYQAWAARQPTPALLAGAFALYVNLYCGLCPDYVYQPPQTTDIPEAPSSPRVQQQAQGQARGL